MISYKSNSTAFKNLNFIICAPNRQSIVNPIRTHLFKKGFMSCVPRNGYEPRNDEIQLNGLLEAYGMNKVSIPADGDCFFSSVSFHLSQILKSGKNTDFAKRLETLG